MSALLFALALAAAQPAETAPPAEAPAAAAPAADEGFPAGAPKDDYQFVAWCYGNLRAYLELHDQVMPEVTRIESTYRPPGRKLSDDMKVYADMEKESRRQLKVFEGAMTAAEKASLRPINAAGAEAVKRGRAVWTVPQGTTNARVAQEWMSWTLPARCEITAKTLESRSKLMGAGLRANAEQEPAEAPPPASIETPAAPPTEAPAAAPN